MVVSTFHKYYPQNCVPGQVNNPQNEASGLFRTFACPNTIPYKSADVKRIFLIFEQFYPRFPDKFRFFANFFALRTTDSVSAARRPQESGAKAKKFHCYQIVIDSGSSP